MAELLATAAKNIKKNQHPAIWELLFLLFIILTTALKHLIFSVLQESRTASTCRDVMYAVIRRLFDETTASQAQYVHPSTDEGYMKGCKRWTCPADTISLDYGARVHWIGKRNAKYVLLYFHGGGYILPATRGHWEYQNKLREQMIESGEDISVLSLGYTLTPNAKYPTQIRQAASALQYLVQTEGRDPSTIIIGGDSAGGNLASALLLHLAKPHVDVVPVELRTPLRGALLISPWVSFNLSQPSMVKNADTDYVTTKSLQKAIANLLPPGGKSDAYTEPLSAPLKWWAIVRKRVVQHFFIWAGGSEILRDGIVEFGTSIRWAPGADSVEGNVHLITTPGEAHEQMIIDPYLKLGSKTVGGAEIEKWLAKMLTTKI